MLGYFDIGLATFRGVLNFSESPFHSMVYMLRNFLRYSNRARSYIQYTDQKMHLIKFKKGKVSRYRPEVA
jgi:hypothetical protein